MIPTFKYRAKQVAAGICIAVVAMLAINDIVFMHAHELPNGHIIIHAHPYSKSSDTAPVKGHHHSTTEYIALSQLHVLFPLSFFALPTVFFFCVIRQYVFYQRKNRKVIVPGLTGRSPPVSY